MRNPHGSPESSFLFFCSPTLSQTTPRECFCFCWSFVEKKKPMSPVPTSFCPPMRLGYCVGLWRGDFTNPSNHAKDEAIWPECNPPPPPNILNLPSSVGFPLPPSHCHRLERRGKCREGRERSLHDLHEEVAPVVVMVEGLTRGLWETGCPFKFGDCSQGGAIRGAH